MKETNKPVKNQGSYSKKFEKINDFINNNITSAFIPLAFAIAAFFVFGSGVAAGIAIGSAILSLVIMLRLHFHRWNKTRMQAKLATAKDSIDDRNKVIEEKSAEVKSEIAKIDFDKRITLEKGKFLFDGKYDVSRGLAALAEKTIRKQKDTEKSWQDEDPKYDSIGYHMRKFFQFTFLKFIVDFVMIITTSGFAFIKTAITSGLGFFGIVSGFNSYVKTKLLAREALAEIVKNTDTNKLEVDYVKSAIQKKLAIKLEELKKQNKTYDIEKVLEEIVKEYASKNNKISTHPLKIFGKFVKEEFVPKHNYRKEIMTNAAKVNPEFAKAK